MTPIQFITVIVLATYFTGLIGIIKEVIQERKIVNPFISILIDTMPLLNRILFYVALVTIGPFMWFRMNVERKHRA